MKDRPMTAIKRDPMPLRTVSALKNIVSNPPTVMKSEGGGPRSFASRMHSSKNSKMPDLKTSALHSASSKVL